MKRSDKELALAVGALWYLSRSGTPPGTLPGAPAAEGATQGATSAASTPEESHTLRKLVGAGLLTLLFFL